MLNDIRALIQNGQSREAEVRLQAILKDHPQSFEAHVLLGIIAVQTNRIGYGAEYLERALRLNSSDREALTWLAVARRTQRNFEVSIEILNKVLQIEPGNVESLNLLGSNLISLGRGDEAEDYLRRSIEQDPKNAAGFANLGMCLRLQNRGEEALQAFVQARKLEPNLAQNHLQVFKQLQQLSRWSEALEAIQIGLQVHPNSLALAEALALTYGRLGRPDEAEKIFRAIAPLSYSAANSYATWLQDEGRSEDSIPIIERSLEIQPIQGLPIRSLVEARQFTLNTQPLLPIAQKIMDDTSLDDTGKMHLAYAIAKLHERDQAWELAAASLIQANQIAYRLYPACRTFDPGWTQREPNLIKERFTRTFFEQLRPAGTPNKDPIFIVGMIRSGTTLLDQIVTSHPLVSAVGEATFWNNRSNPLHASWADEAPSQTDLEFLAHDYLLSIDRGNQSGRFTDKMPLNYRNIGLIRATFPNAKIIHIRRDPFDTCLSIFSTFFAGGPNFAYHQDNIVTFYRAYLTYMEHWRTTLEPENFFEVDYESLVSDPEPTIQSVLNFLELSWDENCLRHEANARSVNTPSRWQARQPIYRTSIGKRQVYGSIFTSFCQI